MVPYLVLWAYVLICTNPLQPASNKNANNQRLEMPLVTCANPRHCAQVGAPFKNPRSGFDMLTMGGVNPAMILWSFLGSLRLPKER